MNFAISKPILAVVIAGWVVVISAVVYFGINDYNRVDQCQAFWKEPCTMVAVPSSIKDSFSKEFYTTYKTENPVPASSTK